MAIQYEKGTIYLDAEEYWAIKAMCGGYDTSDATATAGDILIGKTAYVANGKVTGTYTPDVLIEKTITTNGEYLPASDNADGYSKVTVNVQPTGGNKLAQVLNKTVTELTADDMEGCTTLDDYAFRNCTDLLSVTMSNSVTTIGQYTFLNCMKLANLVFSNNVNTIKYNAFNNCIGLRHIIIPSSIARIEAEAFTSCYYLLSITILATTPPTLVRASAFNYTNDCPIYVPAASVEAYKTATNWSSLADRIFAIQE